MTPVNLVVSIVYWPHFVAFHSIVEEPFIDTNHVGG